jgi:hypothetical protein
MGEVINLNKVAKERRRAAADAKAAANRIRFGENKVARAALVRLARRQRMELDGRRLQRRPPSDRDED